MLETEAHGTLRLVVPFGRQEVTEDREGGKVSMLDAHPTLILEEAAGPDTDRDDLVIVDGCLYAIRKAVSTGRIRCDLKDVQSWRATWSASGGSTQSGRFYLAGGTGSDDHLTAPAGKVLAAVTQDLTLSGIPTRTAIEADGADFAAMGSAPWTPGWTRLALRADWWGNSIREP